MKILLIQPPVTILRTEARKCHPPLGLAYIAASLKDEFEVYVLDAVAEGYKTEETAGREHIRHGLALDAIKKRIAEISPGLVGVSSLFSSQVENVYRVCQAVKEIDNNIVTVVGGIHPTVEPKEVMGNRYVDFIIMGEGEETFKKLAHRIGSKEDISGLESVGFKSGVGSVTINPAAKYCQNLDSIPFPYWDIFPLKKYFEISNPHGSPVKRTPFLPIITSRGCPFECIFCSVHTLWGSTYRKRSSRNVLDELEHIISRFGVREILFEDDNLTLDANRATEIFDGMIAGAMNVTWSTPNGVAVQTLDEGMLTLMKRSGCRAISVGIESGDEGMLKNVIKKPLLLSHAKSIINKAVRLGLEVSAFFVVGCPGETVKTLKNTFRFARMLGGVNVNFFFATPLPGTRMLEVCRKERMVDGPLDYVKLKSERPYFGTAGLSRESLIALVRRERLKLYLLFVLFHPIRFLNKVWHKLIFDPRYFFRFKSGYLRPRHD